MGCIGTGRRRSGFRCGMMIVAQLEKEEDDPEPVDTESKKGGGWQLWVAIFVLLGSLFTVGWAIVETWWG